MNITLLMNHDVASNVALNQLVSSLSAHRLTVFLSAGHGAGRTVAPALQSLRFIEQGLFTQLLFPLARRCPGHGRLVGFDALSERLAHPVQELNRISSPEGMARLQDSEPDLIISMRYGGFLKAPAIALPRFGVINLHAGMLPRYRGLMATFWAMLEGATEYGCTLHYIVDEGVDTGPVIEHCHLPLEPGRSYLAHVLDLYPHACAMVARAVDGIARNGTVAATSQPDGGDYFSLPDGEALRRFEAGGWTLFDGEDVLALAQHYTG